MEARLQSTIYTPITIIKSLKSLRAIMDDVILQKKSTLPPNELVTKEYTPDIKPIIKLITKEDFQKSEKNISYIPPKIKNTQFEEYSQLFHVTDFLGYHYADQNKFDQMIYFKFNNKDFHKISSTGSIKQNRFFSGLFIPPNVLASKHFKIDQNIYKGLSLDYTDYNDSISQSFGKNYKGCSLDPMFSSNYQSGNLMAVIRKQPYEYDLILQNDINSKGVQWFNFAVKFIEEGTYTFNIVNLTNQSPLHSMGMKIPYYSYHQQSYRTDSNQILKSGSGWSYGCKNIKFTKTEVRKQAQSFLNTYYCLKFMFKCKTRNQVCIFANNFPYVCLDYQRFLNRVLFSRIGQHMKMQKIDICDSVGGGKISAYMFYHRKGKSNTLVLKSLANNNNDLLLQARSNEKHRSINLNKSSLSNSIYNTQSNSQAPQKSIVFLARQHSGQTSSSFVLEGILEFLMDNTEYDTFKKNFNFVIIPFINVDGIKYGNQRVNLSGSDLNNVWKNPNKTFQPQIFNIKSFLKNLNLTNPISLLINLQSNRNSISTYFQGSLNKRQTTQNAKIFPYICSKRIKQISYQRSQFYSSENKSANSNCSRAILSQLFPKALVYNFNSSIYGWKAQAIYKKYSETEYQNQIHQFTPDTYRALGNELISTYLQYVRLSQKNSSIRDRWIKEIESLPIQLNSENSLALAQQNDLSSKYQQGWANDAIQINFDLFLPQLKDSETVKKAYEPRKHKTFVYKQNRSSQLRSKAKKRTMPGLQNVPTMNAGYLQNQAQMTAFNKSELQQNLKLFKKSNFSSSIFTPKRRSQILKDISQSIREQKPIETQEKRQGEKRASKYLQRYRQSKLKIKDAMVKFEGMKKFMSTMGIKLDGSTEKA